MSFTSGLWEFFYYSCEANIEKYSEIIRLYFPFQDIKWCQIGPPLFSSPRIGVDHRKSQTTLYQTPIQNRPTLLDNVCERCWSFSDTSCPFENALFQWPNVSRNREPNIPTLKRWYLYQNFICQIIVTNGRLTGVHSCYREIHAFQILITFFISWRKYF